MYILDESLALSSNLWELDSAGYLQISGPFILYVVVEHIMLNWIEIREKKTFNLAWMHDQWHHFMDSVVEILFAVRLGVISLRRSNSFPLWSEWEPLGIDIQHFQTFKFSVKYPSRFGVGCRYWTVHSTSHYNNTIIFASPP